MSLLHQQLLESFQEVESIRKSREYASQLKITLEEQEQAYKVLEKKLAKEQRDADTLGQESVTTWLHKLIGDREEKLEEEHEEYLKASRQHLELYKSLELIRYELKILKGKGNTLDNAEKKVADLMKEKGKGIDFV